MSHFRPRTRFPRAILLPPFRIQTLIRAIADELIYNEQQNEVVFVKYLD